MKQNSSSFLDSKTLVAVILMGVIWFGWQAYLQNKYPKPNPEQVVADRAENAKADSKASSDGAEQREASRQALKQLEDEAQVQVADQPERLIQYENEKIGFQLSSKGMGLKQVILREYTDRDGELIVLGEPGETALFETRIVGADASLDFTIEQVDKNKFEGTANYQGTTVTKTLVVNPKTYSFDIRTQLKSDSKVPAVSFFIGENIDEVEEASFFMAQFGNQEAVVLYNGGEEERIDLSSLDEKYTGVFKGVSMASIGSQYFTSSIVDDSVISPELTVFAEPKEKNILATLVYTPTSALDSLDIQMTAFAGPKSLPLLESVNPKLADTINYGMFSIIARPLLRVLRFWYDMVGNWGGAIILLTLLVRLIVMPFNIMSFKSMKAMQKIQPQIKALRERYKEDPQTLNKEMMALMKENKANPLGGCLPMLLQFPIFIALYQVLGQSIELYQAPFIWWITDLSLKDPYYVLPILMGVSMYLQQKLTPTTMDPAQAKVMMIMPVVFALFMVALPSGLTLYIFTTTLFGIIQQFIFLRDKNSTVSAREAKA